MENEIYKNLDKLSDMHRILEAMSIGSCDISIFDYSSGQRFKLKEYVDSELINSLIEKIIIHIKTQIKDISKEVTKGAL